MPERAVSTIDTMEAPTASGIQKLFKPGTPSNPSAARQNAIVTPSKRMLPEIRTRLLRETQLLAGHFGSVLPSTRQGRMGSHGTRFGNWHPG